jgi:protein associated with RNAse G/E
MVYLGEDHHGTWLGAPMGTVIQRGEEPPMSWHRPFVQLILPEKPWIPIWNVDPDKTAIYVDITTVPTMPAPDRVEAIDLDLDVVQLIDGTIQVLDEDEFAEHRHQLAYPDWLVDQARTSTASVALAIEAKTPPFNGAHLPWFERLANLDSD